MERLKVTKQVQDLDAKFDLHSSMERLKDNRYRQKSHQVYNLHSSMERLKGGNKTGGIDVTPTFTFQYGEIKSSAECKQNARASRIYIPVWRD